MKKLRQFNSPEKIEEMLAEIQTLKGYPNITSIIIQSIIEMHSSIFKDYIYKNKNKKIEVETQKTDELHFKKIKICELLGGDAFQDPLGQWYCKYYDYDNKKRNQQIVPFTVLSEELIRSQYFPNKEKVLKLQTEGKVEYNI